MFDKVRASEKPIIDPRYFRYLPPDVFEYKTACPNLDDIPKFAENIAPDETGSSAPAPVNSTDLHDAKIICFPYFSLQKWVPPKVHSPGTTSKQTAPHQILHPTRTLLQSQYDMVSTEDEDRDKAMKQQKVTGDARIVHVAQVWVLICGKSRWLQNPVCMLVLYRLVPWGHEVARKFA